MKKSFMTRALATGLSLAMAFSLTAATNVTVASAAAKPAMASKQFAVRVGGATKTYKASTATRKTFKISKAVVGNTDKATVVVKSNKKAIKVTPGTVTGSTVVKVTFKNIKTKKTTTLKYRCVVKPEVSKELTMTAEATGVKKIAVTFNQAVDTTTTKIVVKKGSATPTIAATTYAADAKSAEVVMGTKLTAGTYTVEVTAGEKVLTADITVKDETMTSFQLVSTNLVAKPDSDATTTSGAAATISYKALNQYGEAMAASNISATCSFGKTDKTTPTADKNGVVTVSGIPSTLAVDGQTGTLVLVNNDNGVSLNETVTYRPKAVAAVANVVGVYYDKTEKVIEGNIKVGATVGQYKILVNIQDQYGSDMDKAAIINSKSVVSLNPASVLTDLTVSAKEITETNDNYFSDITYDGKTCIAISLKSTTGNKIEKAGTLSLTMVGANKGVLATPTFTVDDAVLIESFSVSAADTVYNQVDNKLVVEAIDANGNAVNKYDDLMIAFKDTLKDTTITLKKNSDGTGTFYYKPNADINTEKQNASIPQTVMFYANETTSGKYIVKPVTFTVYEKQVIKKVAGLANDAVTAVASISQSALKLDLGKLTLEDQYSVPKAYGDLSDAEKANVYAYVEDKTGIFADEVDTVANYVDQKGKIKLTASGIKGSATLYLKYITDSSKATVATVTEEYDIKVTLSAVDITGVTESDLSVKVNDGKAIYGAEEVTLEAATENSVTTTTTAAVVVTAKIGGKTVVIPTDRFTITHNGTVGGYKALDDASKPAEKTETKTVKVVVESTEGPQTVTADVTVSNAKAKITEIKKDSDAKANATDSKVDATALLATVKFVDQYGREMDKPSGVVYTVTLTGKNASDLEIQYNATQRVVISAKSDVSTTGEKYSASVTYEAGGVTFTQDITMNF